MPVSQKTRLGSGTYYAIRRRLAGRGSAGRREGLIITGTKVKQRG
jgi:hypothetical protein